jgi:hypothetical protein
LLDSSEIIENPDHSVLEAGASGFVELGSAEQIIALHIDRKPDHPVWQTETSIFLENQIFLDLIRNLMLAAPNRSPLYFHPWKHAAHQNHRREQ